MCLLCVIAGKEGANLPLRRSLNATPNPSAAPQKARVASKANEVVDISDSDESDSSGFGDGRKLKADVHCLNDWA